MNAPTPGSGWRHVKTGTVYLVQGTATNATNEQNGQTMILYFTKVGELFARERTEFLQKFEPVERKAKR